jgi:hypothetical protein
MIFRRCPIYNRGTKAMKIKKGNPFAGQLNVKRIPDKKAKSKK